MHIDWWTLALQAINFLILAWLLTRFLYHPVRRVIAERQERAEAALKQAAAREAAAEAARLKHERALAEFEAAKDELRAQFHRALEAERQEVLKRAGIEADAIRATARADGEAERRATREAARADIAGLAVALAGRVLEGAEDSPEAQIAAARRALEAMDPDDRAALSGEGQAAGPVRVVTARALDDRGRQAWAAALAGLLGTEPAVEFDDDAQILGGVVLAFPGAELRLTWADYLDEAEARLLQRGPHED